MNDKNREEIKRVLTESEIEETKFLTLSDMRIKMLDYTLNPYRTMVDMALQTWRNKGNKWEEISPSTRFEIVKLILQKKALPLAVEHPTFSFQISDCSRAVFDQIARARIGIVFSSKGQKDDMLSNNNFVIPSAILGTSYEQEVKDIVFCCKNLYQRMYKSGLPNWSLRCILPMYLAHNFMFSANFAAIQNLLSKRLETTEMEECVAFGILVREAIKERFPLLAEYLRPACDGAKKDLNAAFNGFSDIIGLPHVSDNRQPGYDDSKYIAKHKTPCTDIKLVEKMIGKHLPLPTEWIDYTWETLPEIDKERFNENS
jgi:thymidylate synthase ThyX